MKSNKAFVKEIRRSMERSFEGVSGFVSLEGDNPFLLRYARQRYILYVKMLSSAYFHDRPDTTRAQLPKSEMFDTIKRSKYKFLFLGCDVENGVYACWNYHKVKMRLNEKKSVSFYSRLSVQRKVKRGEFLRVPLKNGDEPVLFKWEDIAGFVGQIDIFFPSSALRRIHAADERLLLRVSSVLPHCRDTMCPSRLALHNTVCCIHRIAAFLPTPPNMPRLHHSFHKVSLHGLSQSLRLRGFP